MYEFTTYEKEDRMNLIKYNEEIALDILKKAAQETIEKVSLQLTFWNMEDLKRQTRIKSTATLKEHFFYDQKFPKFKIGRDWYFPVKETQAYLEKYALDEIKRQSNIK